MSNLFCLVCNKSFPEAELSGHVISIHFGFLPFACTSCEFSAAHEAEVLQHADKEGHIPFVIDRSSTKPYLTLLSKFIVGHGKVFSVSKDFAGILTGLTTHIAADLSQLDGPKTGTQLGEGRDSETSSERSVSTSHSTLVGNLELDTAACIGSVDSGTSSLPDNLPLSLDTPTSNGSIELLISCSKSATANHENSISDAVLPVQDVSVTCCALCASNEAFSADQKESHVLQHLNPSGTASKASDANPAAYFSALAKMWQLCFPPTDLVSCMNSNEGITGDVSSDASVLVDCVIPSHSGACAAHESAAPVEDLKPKMETLCEQPYLEPLSDVVTRRESLGTDYLRITDGTSQNVHQEIYAASNADPSIRSTAEDVSGQGILVTSKPSNDENSYPAISLKRKASAVDSVGGALAKAKQPSDSGQGKSMSANVVASSQVKGPCGRSRIPASSADALLLTKAKPTLHSSASTVATELSRMGDDESAAESSAETWPENPFNIQAGQLVWSKYAQCPWWPATVFALYPLEVSPLERSACVLFIESSKVKVQEHGLVNITTDVEPFISSFAKRYNRRRKCLDYQKSCAKAIRQSLTTSADIQSDYFMAHISEQCLRQLKSFAGSLMDVEARHDSFLRRQQAAAAPSDEKKRNHDGATTAQPMEKAEQSEVSAKRTKVAASEPSEVELKVRAAKQCRKLPVNVEGALIRRPNPAHDSASFRSSNQTMCGPHARAAKPIGKLKAYRSSTCQLCSVSVTRDLRRHALRKHFSCLVYECSKCGFGRKAERSKVVGHMRAMHPRDTSVRLIDRSAQLAIKIQQCLNSCFPDRGLSALLVKGMQRRENESISLRKEATISPDLADFDQPCTSGYAAIRVDDHYDEVEMEDSYRESDIEEDNLAIIEQELLRESSSAHAVAVALRGAPVKAEGIHD